MTTQLDKVLYTAEAHTTGGRDGGAGKSSDGALDVKLNPPGSGKAGTNPEQLFAIGYAACFEGAVRFVAGQEKVKVDGASVASSVSIGPREDSGFGIRAKLEVSLPGVDAEKAKHIVQTAHEKVCPYSHATRGNIDVTLTIA